MSATIKPEDLQDVAMQPPVTSDTSRNTPSLSPLSHREWYLQVRAGLPVISRDFLPPHPPQTQVEVVPYSALNDDVRLLGALLGRILVDHEGEAFYTFIEKMRLAAKASRRAQGRLGYQTFDDLLAPELQALSPESRLERLQEAAGAFRLFLTLTGIAEGYHQSHSAQTQQRGLVHTLAQITASPHNAATDLWSVLQEQQMRLVATAHPTTILRQTLLGHQRDIFELLQQLHEQAHDRIQQQQVLDALAEKIEVLWATRFSRWTRPKVKDEVTDVLGYFSRTHYQTLPRFYDKLIRTLAFYNPERDFADLPPFLTLGSWVGGDMDGNPAVNATVFADTLTQQHQAILQRYIEDLQALAAQTSHAVGKASPTPRLLDSLERDFDDMRTSGLTSGSFESSVTTEPHRLKLLLIAERLKHTRNQKFQTGVSQSFRFRYLSPAALVEDLEDLAESLSACGYHRTVRERLALFQRKVSLFGFHFAALDLREDAQNVQLAAHVILTASGLDPEQLSSEAAIQVLTDEILSAKIVSPKQLEPEGFTMLHWPEEQRNAAQRLFEMLQVTNQAHRHLGERCCENLILSMTTGLQDILNALLLLKTEGLFYKTLDGQDVSEMNIVPLFETVTDLDNAPRVFQAMLDNAAYRQQLACRNNTQLIMLGYSDSNKDGGYFASNWLVYKAQMDLLALAKTHGIRLRFFHGRGGNIGRGGGPSQRAIQALPPESCRYGQEMTEQGEVMSRYYNVPAIAAAHLETLFCGLLQKNMADEPPPHPDWLETADRISRHALEKYQALVHHNPHFIAYFEHVTPKEVELVHIGSRPQRRRTMTTVKDLRAIPWVFRWFQARQILPGWYGLGSGLHGFIAANPDPHLERLKTMYQQWPFFKSLLENSEIALRQTDLSIARYYAGLAPETAPTQAILEDIETEYADTVSVIMAITGQPLLDRTEDLPLKNSIALKEPYLDPLNYLQVRLLKQYRALPEDQPTALREAYHQAIVSSIEGIATGLGTTG